ncbi:MAG: type IV pili methyl-accepting chemotaxis transducer N-terminal domain-containing protein [Pseudomonadota bacterium]
MRLELPPPRRSLSAKIVGAILGTLALTMAATGGALYLSWQLEGSAAALNDTASLRMDSYRLAAGLERMSDQPGLRPALLEQLAAIDATLSQLRGGDPQRPLQLPPLASIRASFERVAIQWRQQLAPATRALLELQDGPRQGALRAYHLQTERFVGQVSALVQLIEQDSERRAGWLRASQLGLLGLALAGSVSLIYLMYGLIIAPVNRLHVGMARMRDEQFGTRLEIDGRDEFGQLGLGFNQMADRLQALYGNLEGLVQAKTAELADQNRELALLYDSAAFLQRPQPLDALCRGFLERLAAYFHADGATVRMLDGERDNLHMVVHQGISAQLVASEQCLKVGDCLCGQAVARKVAVVHDLRHSDRAMLLQCHREGYRTVSVFHIMALEQHMGFFNLHFRGARVFGAREHALLETLGQLLGVAIENGRLAEREREMAVSEERNLVAQGLHDSIAQGLNFLNLQVQMLDQSLAAGQVGEARAIVPELRAGVQESYANVRELLLNFRSGLAEGDLLGSLETTVEKFRHQTGIEADLVADLDGAPFPREQQLQLLFIVQEALSNVRKHAQARRVRIDLRDRQGFSLTIADDGSGFDPALRAQDDGHVGMHIMRERALRIDATLEVRSAPGAGTTVALRLPQALRRAA